jgi:hypothetical protein
MARSNAKSVFCLEEIRFRSMARSWAGPGLWLHLVLGSGLWLELWLCLVLGLVLGLV